MTAAKCPLCDARINIPSDVVEGEIIDCPECGLELEVASITCQGVELRQAEIEGEDWGQ
ncbi:TPA: lysine biosynthesis protein LysW [Candidatus Bathyarchaeota archaeon]|nr:lysine biosynthesis protein LysW [Candidatus Bathyarchaeota archaeon]